MSEFDYKPQVIVCMEKYNTRYWDASTLERFAKNALAILTERYDDGYYTDISGETEEWYSRMFEVVKAQDVSFVTYGKGKHARSFPVAWELLMTRSEFEYEGVSLEGLENSYVSKLEK